MTESILAYLTLIATIVEIIGAVALMSGFVLVSIKCIRQWMQEGRLIAMENYRASIARVVLIGLEILIAATIMKTISLEPTFENLSILTIIVLLRVLISWTMALEVDGRWPWQNRAQKTEQSD